ncbi:MAG: acyltransferase [Duncaniella sp.]|nr:acyltransferase [Duncaniella sp.]
MKRKFFLILYYGFATHLPDSYLPVIGKICNRIRIFCCRHIFHECADIDTINRNVYFGNGARIEIGEHSGLGANSHITNNIKIGRDVMIAPELHVVFRNHNISDINVPMRVQPELPETTVTIEDDVWIGQRVIILPGRTIAKGSVVGAGSVVTKDFPPYSIIGGNPARLIRSRLP